MKSFRNPSCLLLTLAFAVLLSRPAAAIIEPVYGETDDRMDLWEVTDPDLARLAASTVILLPASDLEATPAGDFKAIGSRSLMNRRNLCATERFAQQRSLSEKSCSGALVGPDLILTAGHCVPDAKSCQNLKIVFGHSIVDESDAETGGDEEPVFAARDVYSCGKLLTPAYGPANTRPDFAVIRLERKVVGRQPLEISRSKAKIQDGVSLAIIGHPSGLPTKVAAGATVRENLSQTMSEEKYYFYSDLDSYHGNSGSPVFNIDTGLIEGVLTDGVSDLASSGAGCRVSRRCQFGITCTGGEQSARIALAARYIPKL